MAGQPEPAVVTNGEVVTVHQVNTDGSAVAVGRPHVVIVAEEEDELDALLLQGFDFNEDEVITLCPVEAACARHPNAATEGAGKEEEEGNDKQEVQGGNEARGEGKNASGAQACLEVIMVRGRDMCVVWKGREREDGSSQRIVRVKSVNSA